MRLSIHSFHLLALSSALLLSGCALQTSAPVDSITGQALNGMVHGGSQAVIGAHIYVMDATVNASGYGTQSHSLINTNYDGSDSYGKYVLTGSYGQFSVSNKYTCNPNDQVYILASGGNPGLAGGTNNSAIALVAVLGTCPGDGLTNGLKNTVPYVYIDEVSTVAAAFALQQFSTGPGSIGSSSTNAIGLTNAFATAGTLVPVATGVATAQATPANFIYTYPQRKINTLANILAYCVNSNGSTSSSTTPCSKLFTAATTPGGSPSVPTDIFTAALNIAHYPGNNVSSLYTLSTGVASAYQPTVSAQPNDWTLAVSYAYTPQFDIFANTLIDAGGNVWTTMCGESCGPSTDLDTIFKMSPTATLLATINSSAAQSSNDSVQGFAISSSGTLFTTNNASNDGAASPALPDSVGIFNGTTVSSHSPVTGSNLGQFGGVAIDSTNVAWVASNVYGGVVNVNTSGTATTEGLGSTQMSGAAFDPSGNLWVACTNTSKLCEFNSTGTATHQYPNVHEPIGIAADGIGHMWTAGSDPTGLFNLYEMNTSNGTLVTGSGYTNSNLGTLNNLAIDGLGNAWLPSCYSCQSVLTAGPSNAIFVYADGGTLISPSTGYQDASLTEPVGAAIDLSGNVWVVDALDNVNSFAGGLTEFIGAAAPVKTPIQGALSSSGLADQRP